MSFRSRLRLFFALIVIVPMTALAFVLFLLTERSETGKVDAGIAAGARTAIGAYTQAADSAAPALREVASDGQLRAALGSGRGAAETMQDLVRALPLVDAIELRSRDDEVIARAGAADAVAHTGAPLSVNGRRVGVLTVSGTRAAQLRAEVTRLTGLEVAIFRGGELLTATVPGVRARSELGGRGEPRDFSLDGQDYRGRLEQVAEPAGPPVEIGVFRDTSRLEERIARNRLVITGLLLLFLLLALASAALVGRALERQIAKFLSAARRLGRGDFAHPVPVDGNDEFSELGREFNKMSGQLEAKIEEVERKRQELEETIRRVGDALATGLDRDGVVALAVRTALDACGAESGRAAPWDGAFRRTSAGAADPRLDQAMTEAETRALSPSTLGAGVPAHSVPGRRRRIASANADGAYALAIPMRTLVGAAEPGYLGVISIGRRREVFSREEEELLDYLAGQAAVSIENASLHETVERQAVTDELTGLANTRAFHSILDREIERARRFGTPIGLVMVDLDNFKRVNDEYGHQQGDEVLASVAAVLRGISRDIDAPARYGGEELAVISPQTDADGAALLAERMRAAVEELRIPRVDERGSMSVTASFGVACLPDDASDKEGLVAAADVALYRAKRAGRNRVERAESLAAAEPA